MENYCPFCGSPAAPGNHYCTSCGKEFPRTPPGVERPPAPPEQGPAGEITHTQSGTLSAILEYSCYGVAVLIWFYYLMNLDRVLHGVIKTPPQNLVLFFLATVSITGAGYSVRKKKPDLAKILVITTVFLLLLPVLIMYLPNRNIVITWNNPYTLLRNLFLSALTVSMVLFYPPQRTGSQTRVHGSFAKAWIMLMIFGTVFSSLLNLGWAFTLQGGIGLVYAILGIILACLLIRLWYWKLFSLYAVTVIGLALCIINLIGVGPMALSGILGIVILWFAIRGEWSCYDKSL